MPRINSIRDRDLTDEERDVLDTAPIVEGDPISAQYAVLDREIEKVGREVVALVKAGKIKLSRSKLFGETLFVGTETDEYFVLEPGCTLQLADVAEEGADRWDYEGLVANLPILLDTLKAWRDEALAN